MSNSIKTPPETGTELDIYMLSKHVVAALTDDRASGVRRPERPDISRVVGAFADKRRRDSLVAALIVSGHHQAIKPEVPPTIRNHT